MLIYLPWDRIRKKSSKNTNTACLIGIRDPYFMVYEIIPNWVAFHPLYQTSNQGPLVPTLEMSLVSVGECPSQSPDIHYSVKFMSHGGDVSPKWHHSSLFFCRVLGRPEMIDTFR